MGNLLNIHRDVMIKIYKNYLSDIDRILLLWSIGIKYELSSKNMISAAKDNHLNIIKWLKENNCPWDGYVSAFAAKNGNIEMLQWLTNNNCPWNVWSYIWAAENGHLETLKFIKNHGCPWGYYDWWSCTITTNITDPRVIDWLNENYFPHRK